jgi:PmbA protein
MNFTTLKDDLLSVAEEASRVAKKKRISEYEIFVSSYLNSQVTIQGGIVNASDGVSEGIGIRVALGGKVGFASATGIGSDSVRFAAEEALSVARTLDEEDKRFYGFASPRRGGKEGITDKKMLNFTGEKLVSETDKIFSCAMDYDRRVVSVTADVTLNYGGFAVANSNGVERITRSIACGGSAEVTALEGTRRKTGFDFIAERRRPNFTGLGERAARNAVDMLSSESLNASEKMKTIWEPLTAAQFVDTAFSSSINGRSVVEGRSAFAGKMGMEVGIKELTVIDAGQMPESVATTSIDAEGTPRRDTKVIEDGILKEFLFDNYYARIFGTDSTGNASRGSFTNPPTISTTTVAIKTGERKKEEIIAETRRGILITGLVMGMGHSNLISGDFSVVAPSPFLIEKGNIKHALEPVTIAGNLYESLKQLTEIGGDPLLTPFAYTPTLAFEGFTISG